MTRLGQKSIVSVFHFNLMEVSWLAKRESWLKCVHIPWVLDQVNFDAPVLELPISLFFSLLWQSWYHLLARKLEKILPVVDLWSSISKMIFSLISKMLSIASTLDLATAFYFLLFQNNKFPVINTISRGGWPIVR